MPLHLLTTTRVIVVAQIRDVVHGNEEVEAADVEEEEVHNLMLIAGIIVTLMA